MAKTIEEITGKKREEIPFVLALEYALAGIETVKIGIKQKDLIAREYLNWAMFIRNLSAIDGIKEDFQKVADYLTQEANKYKT